MLFNSLEFLLFFPIVTILYFKIPHTFRWAWLLLASCVFYMYFIPIYVLILFFTIIIDYYLGIWIENADGKNKKRLVTLSILSNFGILAVFKYYNFFIDNVNFLTHSWGNIHLNKLAIILPIGLSFHTFQAVSYTIEVYRGNQKAEKHFGIYALYVMFYPQLVAGPIERPQNVLHQFHEKHYFDDYNFIAGMRLIVWGLFKKMVIADRLSIYVDAIYANSEAYSSLNILVALVAFSIQIYCDFSGYSDIAIGSAKTMGFDLMSNFKRPYFSTNIQEFWSRWHISLSTWFRDYLYIPLGGNKKGEVLRYSNLFIVFLVSGLWHGANWTFMVWGAIHGFFTMGYMLFNRFITVSNNYITTILGQLLTFAIVSIAWVYFRAESIAQANTILKNLFLWKNKPFITNFLHQGHSFSKASFFISGLFVSCMFLIEYFTDDKLLAIKEKKYPNIIFISFCTISILLWGIFDNNSFIYFQF